MLIPASDVEFPQCTTPAFMLSWSCSVGLGFIYVSSVMSISGPCSIKRTERFCIVLDASAVIQLC